MNRLLIIALLLVCFTKIFSQPIDTDFQLYKVHVKLLNKKKPIAGTFYSISDSTITLADSYKKKHFRSGNYGLKTIHAKDIQMIKVRKKGSGGKGAAIGFAIGATGGGLLGYAAGEVGDGLIDQGAATASSAIFLGLTGAAIGGIIGEKMMKYRIYGNEEMFKMYQPVLISYSIIKTDIEFSNGDLLSQSDLKVER